MKTKRTKTANDGASIERAAIKRKVNAIANPEPKCDFDKGYNFALSYLTEFINTRTKRTAARKGGLGRK